MTSRPHWIDWQEYQVICCARCDAHFDLKQLPSKLRNARYEMFLSAHSLCFVNIGKKTATSLTVLQKITIDLFKCRILDDPAADREEVAKMSLADARVICDSLARCAL